MIEKHKKSADFWVRQKVLVYLQHKQEESITHILCEAYNVEITKT